MINQKSISLPFKVKGCAVLIILLLINAMLLQAQEKSIAFEKYGVAEGLPEEYAGHVVQDDQGFMWIATQNGLVKYDGYKFQIYQYNPEDTSSKSLQIRNLLGGLMKGRDGKLWVGGLYGGVTSFDPKTDEFNNFLHNSDDHEALPFEFSILQFEDITGNIWFQNIFIDSDTGIVCRIDPETNKIHRYPHHMEFDFFLFMMNLQFAEQKVDSSIWMLERTGNLLKWNRSGDAFKVIIEQGATIPGVKISDSIQKIVSGDTFLYLIGKKALYHWDPLKSQVTRSFINNPEDENSIFSTPINYTFKDRIGQNWVLHQGGKISVISPDGAEVTRMQYGTAPLDFGETSGEIIISHTLLNQDGIWFQVRIENEPTTFLYYQYSTQTFSHYDGRFNYEHNQIPLSGRSLFYGFSLDKTGVMWLNARPNLYKQSPKTNQLDLYRKNLKDPHSLPSDSISCLFEDSKLRLWIGTSNGLALRKTGLEKFQVFKHDASNFKTISDNRVQSIFEDSEGKIWIATRNGLNILNESTSSFRRLFYKEGAVNDVRAKLMEDHLGQIWASVLNQGIFVINKKSGKTIQEFLSSTKESHGMSGDYITALFQDSKNDIWLGDRDDGENGLFRKKEGEDKFTSYVFIPGDSTSIASNEIIYIDEDENNRIWFGTDGGLYLFNDETEGFVRYAENNVPSTSSYSFGKNGEIWVSAYSGNGLVSVNLDNDEIKVFGEDKGLAHNDGSQAMEKFAVDDFGKFWLPNQRGLSVFNPVTELFSNYTTSDGFQEYCRRYTATKTANGDIWIGGQNGLNRIRPGLLLQKEESQPEVWITAVSILGDKFSVPDGEIFTQAISYTKDIQLNHDQKDLTFEFVGLHFLRPEDNLYSWKLENYDNTWSKPSKERKAGYTNLPPGTYIFCVKASNADGVWNEEGVRMIITIAPPWWQSNLAYVMYALLFIAGVIIVDRFQRKRLKEKEQTQAREKELVQAREIEKAYTTLKATQAQLIQSEKMASLGELTAGIAHEIQNPLNFVNNFAEVSVDLVEEMNEEMETGNTAEVKAIAEDLKQNLEKINHHGQRASFIVKGMLEHSRAGDSQKVATNINELADEFLRLSYHGLRAKDKSFNADFKTDFDENLPKINVVSQDIGRVLLNLINNAFYSVAEKNRMVVEKIHEFSPTGQYKPTVIITTKNLGDHIEISVRDNGSGIPDEIKEKIFQPFFTTKPTGQGTGLGLSMSYDIITKGHGGEIKVESKQGKGTEFIIQLAAQ